MVVLYQQTITRITFTSFWTVISLFQPACANSIVLLSLCTRNRQEVYFCACISSLFIIAPAVLYHCVNSVSTFNFVLTFIITIFSPKVFMSNNNICSVIFYEKTCFTLDHESHESCKLIMSCYPLASNGHRHRASPTLEITCPSPAPHCIVRMGIDSISFLCASDVESSTCVFDHKSPNAAAHLLS